MFESIENHMPPEWRIVFKLITLPLRWIPGLQWQLMDLSWNSDLLALAVFKRIFFLLPSLLVIAGFWVTALSLYTIPFRSNRSTMVQTLLVVWWDSLKCIWLFWAGFLRILFQCYGWFWGLLRITVGSLLEIIRQLVVYPFTVFEHGAKRYFRPGVPWIAFLLTIFWSALEAAIFTYTLLPTITEVLSDLVGVETHRYAAPLLYIMLFLLISGSFACMYALIQAIENKQIRPIVTMTLVEIVVMFVEVMFLYRELVDAIAPWIAQQTGEAVRLGLFSTIGIAVFAWLGIRGMTWFLFARYGTPTLLAVISREPLKENGSVERKSDTSLMVAKELVDTFKRETEWLHEKGREMLDALTLPVLQVVACGINFIMVLVSSKVFFNLPFKSLSEVMETKELIRQFSAK